jgi:hypothetical protein
MKAHRRQPSSAKKERFLVQYTAIGADTSVESAQRIFADPHQQGIQQAKLEVAFLTAREAPEHPVEDREPEEGLEVRCKPLGLGFRVRVSGLG